MAKYSKKAQNTVSYQIYISHFFLFGFLILISCLLFLSLISCGYPTKSEVDPPDNFVGTDSTFEVVTWNIQNFPKSSETVDKVAEIIYSINPDVIGLQEIENETSFYQLIEKLNDLDNNTWTGFKVNSASFDINLAIIYKSNVIVVNQIFEIYEDNGRPFPRPPLILDCVYESNRYIIINNHLKCCGNGEIEVENPWDEETRRRDANLLLEDYINQTWGQDNVIVLGDFNDEIDESESDNVFWNFISQPDLYKFADMNIAEGHSSGFSYPTWPSHIDHILITNELFDEFESEKSEVKTIHIDDVLEGGWEEYETNISDHRPVGWSFKP